MATVKMDATQNRAVLASGNRVLPLLAIGANLRGGEGGGGGGGEVGVMLGRVLSLRLRTTGGRLGLLSGQITDDKLSLLMSQPAEDSRPLLLLDSPVAVERQRQSRNRPHHGRAIPRLRHRRSDHGAAPTCTSLRVVTTGRR